LRHGRAAVETFRQFLADVEISIVPFDLTQARAAAAAFDRYGKGLDSKARPNVCDCTAYALLFKGDDFTHTDLRPCR
jgi:ribonuclease VapC